MSTYAELADLCQEFKVVAMRVGQYDAGQRLRFTMADGAKREFSIDDDNVEACLDAPFNWILQRVEDDPSAETSY